jgi:hypothetical protein
MNTKPPAPLEWHPAYRDRTGLIDWLNETGPMAKSNHVVLPVMPRIRFLAGPEPDLSMINRTIILTRRRAFGLAPYVGRPFVYEWWFATDELSRGIAGESRMAYPPTDWRRESRIQTPARNGHDRYTPEWP